MNDFFIASNRSVCIEALGSKIQVNQFLVHNIDLWYAHAEMIRILLDGRSYSDHAILIELCKKLPDQVNHLLMIALSFDSVEMLIDQLKTHPTDLLLLVHTMMQVNSAVFDELYKKPKPTIKNNKNLKNNEKDQKTWFNHFQLLIAMGHTHSEIMQMSYGAFKAYLDAAHKANNDQVLKMAIAMRQGSQASAKDFKKFVGLLN